MIDITEIDRDWLLAFRQRHRLTQTQLADLMGGIAQATILNWERADDDPLSRPVPGPAMQILFDIIEHPEPSAKVDVLLTRGKAIRAMREGGND